MEAMAGGKMRVESKADSDGGNDKSDAQLLKGPGRLRMRKVGAERRGSNSVSR